MINHNTKIQVSGFTFIKNALTLGYPIIESIQSIAPFCDEIIINVGFEDQNLTKDDGTYDYLRGHFTLDKFKFIKNYWDPKKCKDGLILSEQTNLSLDKCQGKICQYIQADEVLHESDKDHIINDYKKLYDHKIAQGLVFPYIHFYANTNIVRNTRVTYKQEIRAIKNNKSIRSWLDAQGFRINNKKINCLQTKAKIYHYGWARKADVMKVKVVAMNKLYKEEKIKKEFEYEKIWGLYPFKGTHPKIMDHWIEKNLNELQFKDLKAKINIQNLNLFLSDTFEKITGKRLFEYKNFKLVKHSFDF